MRLWSRQDPQSVPKAYSGKQAQTEEGDYGDPTNALTGGQQTGFTESSLTARGL